MSVLPIEAETAAFPHARSILKAETFHLDRPDPAPTVRYFISSWAPKELSLRGFATGVRNHWNIENGTHWRRDVLWGEDKQRMKHHGAAHILSTLRQVALYLHTTSHPTKPRSVSSALQHVHHHKPSGIALLRRPP